MRIDAPWRNEGKLENVNGELQEDGEQRENSAPDEHISRPVFNITENIH